MRKRLLASAAAGAPAALFEGFSGTMGLSDFPCPFVIEISSRFSRCGLGCHPPEADTGSPG
jgi:hypothetical protein